MIWHGRSLSRCASEPRAEVCVRCPSASPAGRHGHGPHCLHKVCNLISAQLEHVYDGPWPPLQGGIDLGRIASMEKDHKAVDTAKRGDAVAMKIEVRHGDPGGRCAI